MGYEVKRTEHAGAKNGQGFWGLRAIAKHESSRVRRRVNDRAAVEEGLEDWDEDVAGQPTDDVYQAPAWGARGDAHVRRDDREG